MISLGFSARNWQQIEAERPIISSNPLLGLRGRINQYYSPGPPQPTNKRIIALVGESYGYEIGWVEVPAKFDAVALEQRLLERYAALDCGDRPPQNLKSYRFREWRHSAADKERR